MTEQMEIAQQPQPAVLPVEEEEEDAIKEQDSKSNSNIVSQLKENNELKSFSSGNLEKKKEEKKEKKKEEEGPLSPRKPTSNPNTTVAGSFSYDILGDRYIISHITENDVETLSKMMARATFEDPLLTFVTDGYSKTERLSLAAWLLSKLVSFFLQLNPQTSWCIRDKYNNDIACCCIALTNYSASTMQNLQSFVFLPFKLGVSNSLRFSSVWDILDRNRETVLRDESDAISKFNEVSDVPSVKKHAYIAFIATEPELQRRGFGKLLLHFVTEELERKHYISYVDTSSRYENLFHEMGFRTCYVFQHKDEVTDGPITVSLMKDLPK